MNEKDWQMLKVIAEEKNITRAAARLYISQPSLSYRLKALEEEMGTALVLRTPTGILLTSEGEYLYVYAQTMLHELRDVKEHIKDIKGSVQGVLRLASSSVFAYYELPALLKGFKQQYPNVEILLKTSRSPAVNRLLQNGEVPLAFTRGDYHWLDGKYLFSEEPICLVSISPLDIDKLPLYPRIIVSSSEIQGMVEEWWHQTFTVSPYITLEVDSMDICRQMALHGLGWGVMPAIGLKGFDSLYKQALYWKNGEPLVRRTWLMFRNSALQLPTVEAFVKYVKSVNL
ncbi:MAG: LysR family transcriptional regulator [Negativicutes bacterium]